MRQEPCWELGLVVAQVTRLFRPATRRYLFTVAQTFNLPYRRFLTGRASAPPKILDLAYDPRYSRLQVCATSVGDTLNRYSRRTARAAIRADGDDFFAALLAQIRSAGRPRHAFSEQ